MPYVREITKLMSVSNYVVQQMLSGFTLQHEEEERAMAIWARVV